MPFSAIFVPGPIREAVSDHAWFQGLLDAERALATAEAEIGLVTEEAAARIAQACRVELYDTERLAEEQSA